MSYEELNQQPACVPREGGAKLAQMIGAATVSEVDRESTMALKSMEQTASLVKQLVARLNPVLQSDNTTNKSEGQTDSQIEPHVGSGVGQKFRALALGGKQINAALQHAIARLAV